MSHVRAGLLSLWDITRAMVKNWSGTWRDAAISPDGGIIAMLNGETIYFVEATAGWSVTGKIQLPGNAYAIDLSEDKIAVALMGQEGVRIAQVG